MPWVAGKSGNPSGIRRHELTEIRHVKKLCLERTEEAIQTVIALMTCAEKDSVRLAAALAVLKIAGVKMDASDVTVNVTPQPVAPKPTPERELVESLSQTDAPPLN